MEQVLGKIKVNFKSGHAFDIANSTHQEFLNCQRQIVGKKGGFFCTDHFVIRQCDVEALWWEESKSEPEEPVFCKSGLCQNKQSTKNFWSKK